MQYLFSYVLERFIFRNVNFVFLSLELFGLSGQELSRSYLKGLNYRPGLLLPAKYPGGPNAQP